MERKVEELKDKLRKIDTKEMLGYIANQFIIFGNTAESIAKSSDITTKTKLRSPQKQYLYLAGLLMSTDEPNSRVDITNEEPVHFEMLEADLQSITDKYVKKFMNIEIDASLDTFEVIKKHLASFEAFTSYFDTGILRYNEQTIALINGLYGAFDDDLQAITNLRIEDFIQFYELVNEEFERSITSIMDIGKQIKDFLMSINPSAPDIRYEYQRMLNYAQSGIGNDLQEAADNIFIIPVSSILKKFGEKKGRVLIDTFSLERKERDFTYYNGKNPFVEKPLCRLDGGQFLFVLQPQFVLNAIFDYITDKLEYLKNSFSEKYKRIKANVVEKLFLDCLKSVFGENAKYYTKVCEEFGTKEHDILVEYGNYLIIAEVKASKVREPFFNPEKAFTRIKDHFFSDSGIGGAYNQCLKLKSLLEKQDTATLYMRNEKIIFKNLSQKIIIPVVFTLNQFGGLAVNTSLLIKIETGQPYPWVCNLHDFQNIVKINNYLHKSPQDFIEYILWRNLNHQFIFSSDELDVFEGYYLDSRVRNSRDKSIIFSPTGPRIVDKIYFEEHGIPYHHPFLDDKT